MTLTTFITIAIISIAYGWYHSKRYKKLYSVSSPLLQKYYKEYLVEKISYLWSLSPDSIEYDYKEIWERYCKGMKEELNKIPKEMRDWVWSDAVNIHDTTVPKAISSDGVWGKTMRYNELKAAIGIS